MQQTQNHKKTMEMLNKSQKTIKNTKNLNALKKTQNRQTSHGHCKKSSKSF